MKTDGRDYPVSDPAEHRTPGRYFLAPIIQEIDGISFDL